MQYEKEDFEKKKARFLRAAGKVAVRLRKVGKNKFAIEYNVPIPTLIKFENGQRDVQITTVCRLAHAHGLKCSEFLRLVEADLPEDFNFYSQLLRV